MTISQALRDGAEALIGAGLDETPRLDVELLMAHALGVSRSDVLLRHMGGAVPDSFAAMLERRLDHEPIAYILGEQEFFGLTFRVTPAVLIPRGDSEVLVEAALAARPDARRVLDCGTGSGALLLAVLAHLPNAEGVGIDRSEEALAVAAGNADRLGLESRTRMLPADWDKSGWRDDLGGQFDLILANPPYVESDAALAQSVSAHEPADALFAGLDGLDAYRILIPQLPDMLTSGGAALVEIGATQADSVAAIALEAGFSARHYQDLAGHPRAFKLSVE